MRRRSAVAFLAAGVLLAAGAVAQMPPKRPLTEPRDRRPSYVYDGDGRLIGTARPSRGGTGTVLLFGRDGRLIGAARRRGRDLFLFDGDGQLTDAIRPRERVVLRRGRGGALSEVTREPAATSYGPDGERREARRAPRPFEPQREVDRFDFGAQAGGVGRR